MRSLRALAPPFFALVPCLALAPSSSAQAHHPTAAGGNQRPIDPAGAPFELVSLSVPDNSVWQINRPIDFHFSADVDIGSVNANTLSIRRVGGAPAAGDFFPSDPRTIVFQPRCPSQPDFSDGGFAPGGVLYSLDVASASSGMPTVRSTNGGVLASGVSLQFTTPASTRPSILFLDTVPGPPSPVIATSSARRVACHIELAQDSGERVYFAPRAVPDPELGADVPAGFRAPLNLYSQVRSRVAILVALDQMIDPSPLNLADSIVRLEYRTAPGVWRSLPHTVSLDANCSSAGALVRIEPMGILPQGRAVRVVLASTFTDIVGEGLIVPLTVGSFEIATALDPGTTTPGDGADEVLEEFALSGDAQGSLEDEQTPLDQPRAHWGDDGRLTATIHFEGTGGPGGNFDWVIGDDSATPSIVFVIDTSYSLITNSTSSALEAVIHGHVDVRNFTVKPNGILLIQGPNPCRILASGSVLVQGKINARGSNNFGVNSINTTNIPEPGAAGQAGGGRGGTGNTLTTESTPAGETGFGAFHVPLGGGGGGETGFNPISDVNLRRPGGGGGGRLGMDVLLPPPNTADCPDQSLIGLDGENGFNGSPNANGALSPLGTQPHGGTRGPRPFFDNDPNNDFWGTMLTQGGALIAGELSHPLAGAGGGAGGDACLTSNFPTTPFSSTGDEKGAGGGGGGGSISIFALGPITIGALGAGAKGSIDASGGNGGGGENTIGFNRVGGGSGGGSGGHIVLQSATRIDFTFCRSVVGGGVYAVGGQGGAGANDLGGAHAGGLPTTPLLDALPPNSYPSPGAPCAVVGNTVGNPPAGQPTACGGDGGPGIIQLHAPNLADIVPPNVALETGKILRPPPVGTTLVNVNLSPTQWDQMLPMFGARSRALSKWIALGAASVDPSSPLPDQVRFAFAGTNSSGAVITNGSGSAATVAELPPIFSGTIAAAPATPFVSADARSLVIDGSLFPDDIWLRNPNLLRRFALIVTQGASSVAHEVGAASYDASTGEMRLTVEGSGMPLASAAIGDSVEVRPRFFRAATEGALDALPDSAHIVIEFQAAPEDAQGRPDETLASPWRADITQLNSNPSWRFLRFRVSFDLSFGVAPVNLGLPRASLEFFRVPFRF